MRRLALQSWRKPLFIFPHPDDEIHAAGLLHRLSKQGAEPTLLILTEGEASKRTPYAPDELRQVRKQELARSCEILGITHVFQYDFGDGQLATRQESLRSFLQAFLVGHCPDVIVTYEPAGLYGHPDHCICSQLVTELSLELHIDKLLYITYPRYLLHRFTLRPELRAQQRYPTHACLLGMHLLPKLRALYSYKSQLASFKKGMPRWIPAWLPYSLLLHEYVAVYTPGDVHSQH